MTRNQKIALGCGGAGCLGLILLVVIGIVLGAAGYIALPGSSNSNYNYNSNSNSNYNRNSNSNSSYSRNSNSSTSTSMSSDDQHKLYQAAGMTRDSALIQRVTTKLGLADQDAHQAFVKEHFSWAMKNLEFIQSVNTPEKARVYVEEHIDD